MKNGDVKKVQRENNAFEKFQNILKANYQNKLG